MRAMYACCGATDYYLETGDQAYWKTLTMLWEDLSQRQMYITGGVGARSAGEAFGEAYELAERAGIWRELRGDRQHDVELAHARGERRSEVRGRDRAGALQRDQSGHVAGRDDVLLSQSAGVRSGNRARRFEIRGTTRRAARRIWSGRSRRCRDIFTARARTAFTCICTTTRRWTGIWKTARR